MTYVALVLWAFLAGVSIYALVDMWQRRCVVTRRPRMVGRSHEQAASIFGLQMKCADDLARHRPDLLALDNGARKRSTNPASNGSSRAAGEGS